MNRQHVTLLVFLDLSSAFVTVDHAILLNRLESLFGISETALSWFKSYLSDRKQYVSVDAVSSSENEMKYGVPQRFCLGPLLFTLYTSPLFKLIKVHLPNIHCYADDTQLYLSFKPGSQTSERSALGEIEACVYLYNFRRIRNYLSKSACETLINALVVSRLYYCNSLFYGHPAKLVSQLQHVQNSAARLIHQSTRYSPSSLLQDLHWLPIKYRCILKILLIIFKAINGHAPSYIQDLVKVKHQTRTLRSSTATYLDYPSIKSSIN